MLKSGFLPPSPLNEARACEEVLLPPTTACCSGRVSPSLQIYSQLLGTPK